MFNRDNDNFFSWSLIESLCQMIEKSALKFKKLSSSHFFSNRARCTFMYDEHRLKIEGFNLKKKEKLFHNMYCIIFS